MTLDSSRLTFEAFKEEVLKDYKLAWISRHMSYIARKEVLGVNIPQTTVPVAPGRNLAIQVETAVRQHLLTIDGYNAADDLTQRQREFIDRQAE